MINGLPTGFFQSTRGLRQGDPLFPYLFVIGMEALSCLINIRGRSGDDLQITHLLFADDTLVFCEASQEQMSFLSWLLMWFEAISGLSINLDKSEFFFFFDR